LQGALAVLQPVTITATAQSHGNYQQQQQQQGQGQPAGQAVPSTQAGWLACLLGVPLQQAEDLLAANPKLKKITWRDWGVRLKACEGLLVCLGLLSERTTGTANSSSSSSSSADSEGSTAGSLTLATQHKVAPTPASSDRRVFCAEQSAQPVLAAAQAAAAAAACREDAQVPEAAVAAATIALHLADFSPQLSPVPMAVPPLVAQLVLTNPKAFSAKKGPALTESCRLLQLLVQQHPEAREVMLEGGVPGLAQLLGFSMRRMAFLEFLLQTGVPWPWPLPLKHLLTGDNFTKIRRPLQHAFTEWQQQQAAAAEAMMLLPPASTTQDAV
jgi:hypothetical protein